MNRKNLTSAVLAGLAGAAGIAATAQAVNINPDGLGQVLIYPYYTTNGGNDTLLSVVNTTEDAKAVKVRFLEGQNTREVLDFNLYLSPFDVWTAALVDGGSLDPEQAGVPHMITTDSTCTVPYIYDPAEGIGVQAFLTFALTDGGSDDISRTTEGHFEMIEMGTMTDESEGSATAATHVDGTPPETAYFDEAYQCGQLVDAWTDPDDTVAGDEGYWLLNPATDIDAPSGGLFGGAAIVNVDNGYMVSYDAKAINGFATTVDAADFLHQSPGDTRPNLNSGDVTIGTVFLDNGDDFDSDNFSRGVDAVSFVFMHDTIMNEYTTEAAIGAGTEWVVTFPTKHFYVYEPSIGGEAPVAPFTSEWGVEEGEEGEPDTLILPCEVVGLDTIWDREEQSPTPTVVPGEPIPPIVSPAPPPVDPDVTPIPSFELCYETSVIRFGSVDEVGDTTEILGSSNFHNIDNEVLGFDYGWARLELDDYPHDQNENGVIDGNEEDLSRDELGGLEGLPVTGFAVMAFQNAFLGDGADVLANYGGIFQHKGTRQVSD